MRLIIQVSTVLCTNIRKKIKCFPTHVEILMIVKLLISILFLLFIYFYDIYISLYLSQLQLCNTAMYIPSCCIWTAVIDLRGMKWRLLSWHHQSTIFNGSHPRVNICLSSQIVFSRAICSLWTSQSPSCELNNQWFPFWQPQGYLAKDRERETLHVCSGKKTKNSL